MIARRLGGGISRNAVIGKVHRLGLPGMHATSHVTARSYRSRRPRNKVDRWQIERISAAQAAHVAEERAAVQAQPDLYIEPQDQPNFVRSTRGGVVANDALDERACRWTYGNGTKDD